MSKKSKLGLGLLLCCLFAAPWFVFWSDHIVHVIVFETPDSELPTLVGNSIAFAYFFGGCFSMIMLVASRLFVRG